LNPHPLASATQLQACVSHITLFEPKSYGNLGMCVGFAIERGGDLLMIRRREFIAGIGGAVTWSLAARAQQRERMRRIGALMNVTSDDPESSLRVAAFSQGLQELGWSVGRNVRIDWRWAGADRERARTYAAELVALAPEVVLTSGLGVRPMLQATRTVPIVFAGLNDPVGAGVVRSLAQPGGNVTGFALSEYGFSTKWLELLKQIEPRLARVAIIRDPLGTGGPGYLGALQGVAPSLRVELSPIDATNANEIESAVTEFARLPNGGVIVPPSSAAWALRELILLLAAKQRLPAVYPSRSYVEKGGLISYGPFQFDNFRAAAGYVDRILKGEKPADLPVQAPTRYELVINLKTARALRIELPATLLARADEVIE
jgi:putative tryptophan/tyrosine transport system substrate-binding protein